VSFLNTVTVFGTASDVTLSELALEMLFPADAETVRIVSELTRGSLTRPAPGGEPLWAVVSRTHAFERFAFASSERLLAGGSRERPLMSPRLVVSRLIRTIDTARKIHAWRRYREPPADATFGSDMIFRAIMRAVGQR